MITNIELIEEVKEIFNQFNKVSIQTELHDGTCWYCADDIQFNSKFKAINYVSNLELDGNTVIHVYNNTNL